jgi:branched-chain amino acid transport system ATP-binding protein
VTALLSLSDVSASYGPIEVLHEIDLEVPAGRVVAILGPNGAGKTTLLNVIAGLHRPQRGSVALAGRRIDGAAPDALARVGLCLIPEGRGIFPNLTVAEHLRMATHSGRRLAAIEAETYERFPRLAERRHQLAGTMSGGEQQMLALARGLATRPALLLLDELSMGLAPLIVTELYEQVVAIAASGVSIVVVEQFAHAVLGVADLAAVLVNGRMGALGPPAQIEEDLSAAYLGDDLNGRSREPGGSHVGAR